MNKVCVYVSDATLIFQVSLCYFSDLWQLTPLTIKETALMIYVKFIMCQETCYEMHLIYTDPFNPHNNDTEPETHRDE